VITASDIVAQRLVTYVSGSNRIIDLFANCLDQAACDSNVSAQYYLDTSGVAVPDNIANTDMDSGSKCSHTDAAAFSINYVGAVMGWKNVSFSNFYVCGRAITVTGLPTGYKAKLDSHTAVSESGGTATINCDEYGLPGTTVTVTDSVDVTVATISPSGGVYGGDSFSFTATGGGGQWVDVTAAQVAASIDHGLVTGLADDDHTQYLLADGTRALTGNWAAGDFSITLFQLTLANDAITNVGADLTYTVDGTRKHIFKVSSVEVFRVEPTQVYCEYTFNVNTADIYVDAGYGIRYEADSGNAYIPFPAAGYSLIRSDGNFIVQIDVDNDSAANFFEIRHDASSHTGGTSLWKIDETGAVTHNGDLAVSGDLVVGSDPGGVHPLRVGGGAQIETIEIYEDGVTGNAWIEWGVDINDSLFVRNAFRTNDFLQITPFGRMILEGLQNTNCYMRVVNTQTTSGARAEYHLGNSASDERGVFRVYSIAHGTHPNKMHIYTNGAYELMLGSNAGAQVKILSAAVTIGTDLIAGTDPGGSERLRVGGSIRVSTDVVAEEHLTSLGTSTSNFGRLIGGSAGMAFRNAADAAAYMLWTDSTTVLSLLNSTGSAVTIGTDPTGSEILRIGGGWRANDSCLIYPSTGSKAFTLRSDDAIAFGPLGDIFGNWNGTSVIRIRLRGGSDGTNKDEGNILISTAAAGGSLTNALQITHTQTVLCHAELEVDGDFNHDGSNWGMFGTAPVAQQTVTGSRGGNAALADLLTKLANYGAIIDSTSA
jgi:hypothetical protein